MTHSSDVGSNNVPAFLTKLWKLVEDPNYDHLIHWAQNGKSFIISNQAQFAKELLPLYFKHNNMASFIRQLNMYGFRKLTNIENSGLRAERDDIEFYHLHFVKDQESSLELIKRKIKTPLQVSTTPRSIDENEVRHDDVGSILVDVKAIKGKQDTVDNILVNMQKENEALWREIAILRRKYQKQQHIVEKLLQFLLSLVQQRGIGVKRKSPLMIGLSETNDSGDSDGEFSKSKRLASDDQIDTLNKSLGPLIFDVSDDVIDTELAATANTCPIIATAELSPLTGSKSESPIEDLLTSDQIVSAEDLDPLTSTDPEIPIDHLLASNQIVANHNMNPLTVATKAAAIPIDDLLTSSSNQLVAQDDLSSLTNDILSSTSHQTGDPEDPVDAFLDPIQSAIDSSIMVSDSDFDQQLNSNSNLTLDPTLDIDTIKSLFDSNISNW